MIEEIEIVLKRPEIPLWKQSQIYLMIVAFSRWNFAGTVEYCCKNMLEIYFQEVNLAYENVKEVDGLDVSKEGSDAWEAAIKR